MNSSETAEQISRLITTTWATELGPALWGVISKEKHWYPAGYGHGSQSTREVMKSQGLEAMYVVPFRQSSSALHAVDFDRYLDENLKRVPESRSLGVIASAQESLCASTALVCRHYGFVKPLHQAQVLHREGARMRKRM